MEQNKNLDLWNRVQETDPKYTKKVNYRNKFTSINATYQIRTATGEWGMYGTDWGIESIEYEFKNLNQDQILVLAKAVFKYPTTEGHASFPISSTIFMQEYSKKYSELQVDDEWAKKVETDITTKALSKLGFNADVFLGLYDDNRYLNKVQEKYKELPPIGDVEYDKYIKWISEETKDKNNVLITKDYLRERHILNAAQESALQILDLEQ